MVLHPSLIPGADPGAERRDSDLFTPKGLHNTAQGKRSAALGYQRHRRPYPERVAQKGEKTWILSNPFRVDFGGNARPQGCLGRQPWAVMSNPFGVKTEGFNL